MKNKVVKILILLILVSSGCAYYNTFFNAKKFYGEAEKEREKRLEQERKDKRNAKRNLDRLSSGEVKKYDDAIRNASKVLEVYPKSKYVDDALFLLGKCFFRKRDFQKARRKFHELKENFPNSEYVPESLLWLGKVNIEMRDYKTAEKNFRDVLNSGAKEEIRDEAQFLLGGLFKHKGDFITAVDQFETAAKRAKEKDIKAEAFFEMGECQFELKNYQKAADSYESARKFSPDEKFEFKTMFKAGLALKELQKYDEAIKIFTNFIGDIVNEDNWPVCRLEIANCYRLKGDFTLASQWYSDIAEQHPKSEEASYAYYYLAKMYQEVEGDYKLAKEYYDKSATENTQAEIVSEARTKSKSIQDLLNLQDDIKAQQKRIAAGDSIAAVMESMEVDENKLPQLTFTRLDTLVATTLEFPIDSLRSYQDSLLSLYKTYYSKNFDEYDQKIVQVKRLKTDKPELILLDSLVAVALEIPLNYIEDYADSLRRMYDRNYLTYKKNKLIYDQFFLQNNNNLKGGKVGTPQEELIKDKLLLAEIYLFEFEQPDSALKAYIDILEIDTSSAVIPKTLYSIGYICETYKQDTTLADSVFNRLITNYPDHPLAQYARKKIKTFNIMDPEQAVFERYQLAEHEYLDLNKYTSAINLYSSIAQDYPSSDYAPRSLFAVGWIYENHLMHYDKAIEVYQNLVDNYSETVYANKVKKKINEVLKARSDSTEQVVDTAEVVSEDKTDAMIALDSQDNEDVATMNPEQYRRYLRIEMEKNDPRRTTPKRW